jgi:hypothetical protein
MDDATKEISRQLTEEDYAIARTEWDKEKKNSRTQQRPIPYYTRTDNSGYERRFIGFGGDLKLFSEYLLGA